MRQAHCDFDGCDRPHKARGLCSPHDAQRRRGMELYPVGSWVRTAADPADCWRCAEVAHLADAGEVFERVAERLGSTPKALERHLRRHHRLDLLAIPHLAAV